jgi:uncharacterized membrane protein
MSIPFTNTFESTSKTPTKQKKEKSKGVEETNEHESVKELKMRYARGEITKKKYLKMKKDLES